MFERMLAAVCVLLLLTTGKVTGDEPVANDGFRIVGYLPDYRAAEFDAVAPRGLTDLIVFSAEPGSTGDLNLDRLKNFPWSKVRQFKTRHRVRLILCVGGWDRSQHFAAITASAERRAKFVKAAIQTCLDQRLDGIDIDWEHPQNEQEQQGYAALLTDLHTAFQPHGLTLSVTMAAWQRLPREAFTVVDAVHIMSYDNKGRHSTFEAAKSDIEALQDQGAAAGKIVLGMPFYGRHTSQPDTVLTYRQIVEKYKPAPDADEVDSIYFNGPRMIQRKTKLALESQLGGVMVWELGQDMTGPQSLLKVIEGTVRTHQNKTAR